MTPIPAAPALAPLDPALSLALSIHANPGAYALLIGSGVSRAAGIPTGWEVVLELIRRLARLDSHEREPSSPGGDDSRSRPPAADGAAMSADDLVAWYAHRFGQAPEYGALLRQLTSTPSERQALLREFFEPNDEERDAGLKAPTSAHRAIATLARSGHIRVIITTNFDQLLETALRDVGVTPTVLSSNDAIKGMVPLHLSPVTIVKVHGDYRDTRIRNTPTELEAYPAQLNKLLDRILDDYGLVVAGWSATWDTALRAAISRCPTRRFAMFWTHVRPLNEEADALVTERRATPILISDADAFFAKLEAQVTSLTEARAPAPASTEIAVATLKRFLPASAQRIRLHDLLHEEVERVVQRVIDETPSTSPTDEAITTLITRLDAAAQSVIALLAAGAYFGTDEHDALWVKTLERLGNVELGRNPVSTTWAQLAHYPAQLAFYAAGVAAFGARRENSAATLLIRPSLRRDSTTRQSPAMALHVAGVVDDEWAKHLPGLAQRKTPMSDHLHAVLRPAFLALIPDQQDYDDAFDRFEYIVALTFLGLKSEGGTVPYWWMPLGRFAWRHRVFEINGLASRIDRELTDAGSEWALVRCGVFPSPSEVRAAAMAIANARSRIAFP